MQKKLSAEFVKDIERMKTKIHQTQQQVKTLEDDEPLGESIQEIIPQHLKSVSDRESDHMRDSIRSTKVLNIH